MDLTRPPSAGTEPALNHDARRFAAALGPEVPLDGVPAGLVARSVQRVVAEGDGWRIAADRRQRLRLTEVALTTDGAAADRSPVLDPGQPEARFVLGAARRNWSSVQRRFGERAWPVAVELARSGVLAVRCTVTEDVRRGPPTGWHLLEHGARLAIAHGSTVAAGRDHVEQRRSDLISRLAAAQTTDDVVPGISADAAASLLHALRHETGRVRRAVLLAATADLLDGVTHDGPRAFSLAHFADSKVRDDALSVLSDAGVGDEVALILGLRRAPRLGVAGAIDAVRAGTVLPLSILDGPVLLRADQPALRLVTRADHLVIVENLQAAEALAERVAAPGTAVAVVYTAGTPSAAALGLIADLTRQAGRVLLCPDADLGGVRITAAVLDALPTEVRERVAVCDPGQWPHRPQRPWPLDGATVRGLEQYADGPASELARACLDRGYRVEQEEAVRAATEHWLVTDEPSPHGL